MSRPLVEVFLFLARRDARVGHAAGRQGKRAAVVTRLDLGQALVDRAVPPLDRVLEGLGVLARAGDPGVEELARGEVGDVTRVGRVVVGQRVRARGVGRATEVGVGRRRRRARARANDLRHPRVVRDLTGQGDRLVRERGDLGRAARDVLLQDRGQVEEDGPVAALREALAEDLLHVRRALVERPVKDVARAHSAEDERDRAREVVRLELGVEPVLELGPEQLGVDGQRGVGAEGERDQVPGVLGDVGVERGAGELDEEAGEGGRHVEGPDAVGVARVELAELAGEGEPRVGTQGAHELVGLGPRAGAGSVDEEGQRLAHGVVHGRQLVLEEAHGGLALSLELRGLQAAEGRGADEERGASRVEGRAFGGEQPVLEGVEDREGEQPRRRDAVHVGKGETSESLRVREIPEQLGRAPEKTGAQRRERELGGRALLPRAAVESAAQERLGAHELAGVERGVDLEHEELGQDRPPQRRQLGASRLALLGRRRLERERRLEVREGGDERRREHRRHVLAGVGRRRADPGGQAEAGGVESAARRLEVLDGFGDGLAPDGSLVLGLGLRDQGGRDLGRSGGSRRLRAARSARFAIARTPATRSSVLIAFLGSRRTSRAIVRPWPRRLASTASPPRA